MKKIFFTILMIIMMLAFTACGDVEQDTSELAVGQWTNTENLLDGQSYYETLGGESLLDFDLKSDGTGTVTTFGVTADLKWSVQDEIIIIDDGIDKIEAYFTDASDFFEEKEGKVMVIENSDSNSIIFEKE